jgi:hypothetical protein
VTWIAVAAGFGVAALALLIGGLVALFVVFFYRRR